VWRAAKLPPSPRARNDTLKSDEIAHHSLELLL